MADYRLGKAEAKFADIIWDNEPIGSGELAALALERLGWKKSTTYTVLRKLCERGIFRNVCAVVTSLVKRDEFFMGRSRAFVEDSFGGSLPRFLAAFMGGGELDSEQIDEIRRLIDEHKGEQP
jgi:predicted transcriptional regulator